MGEIKRELNDGVLTLTMSSPGRANAWENSMRAVLVSALDGASADDTIRAVVVTGEGDRAFCAGQDLKAEAAEAGRAASWQESYQRLYTAMRRFPKPLVAAINGAAIGSGFQFALMADLRVGHPGVRMGQTEIKSGGSALLGINLLYEAVGRLRATELLLRGTALNGTEAREYGLLTELVPAERVCERAVELAVELAGHPPAALALTKSRLATLGQPTLDRAFAEATDAPNPYASLRRSS